MDETNGNVRIRWREDCIKCFLEACIHEVTKIGKNGSSLKKRSWMRVQKELQEVCNLKVTQKQMKNHYDYLHAKFSVWVQLKRKMGNHYNPKTNTFNLTNVEWNDFIKDHPKAKSLRSCPLVFPDLCTRLFERNFTIGENRWSPSSTLQRSRGSPSSLKSKNNQLVEIEKEVGTQNQSTLKSPNVQSLAIEDIPSNSQDGQTQNPSTPKSQNVQLLAIEDIPSNSQEGQTQNPSTPKSPNIQLLENKDFPSNSQEGQTQNPSILKSPSIQLLENKDIPSNSQEGQTENPSTLKSPNTQLLASEDIPRNSQQGQTQNPPNSQEGGTQNPSTQCSESATLVPLDDTERPSALNPNLNGKKPKRKSKTLNVERAKKKGKTMNVPQLELEVDMSNALKIIIKSQIGPSQNECVEKLNQIGWAKNSSSYVAALGIFCEGPSYREGWMLLPIDNVELLELWVASIGKKLGYL